ncbi:hypothetical protein LEMLEM_LOCUS26013 [Lemmus lemmus]
MREGWGPSSSRALVPRQASPRTSDCVTYGAWLSTCRATCSLLVNVEATG